MPSTDAELKRERRFRETVSRLYDELYPQAQCALDDLLQRLGGKPGVVLQRGLSVRNIGRAAGKCAPGGALIVNSQLVDFPDDVRDTLAHELAHAVVETARLNLPSSFWRARGAGRARDRRNRTGPWSSHGALWKDVATRLGDSGDRCHRLPLQPVRRLRRYLYRADCGTEVVLTSVRHRRLQRDRASAYHWPRKGVSVRARHYVEEIETD